MVFIQNEGLSSSTYTLQLKVKTASLEDLHLFYFLSSLQPPSRGMCSVSYYIQQAFQIPNSNFSYKSRSKSTHWSTFHPKKPLTFNISFLRLVCVEKREHKPTNPSVDFEECQTELSINKKSRLSLHSSYHNQR
jgi:hypothetical protein